MIHVRTAVLSAGLSIGMLLRVAGADAAASAPLSWQALGPGARRTALPPAGSSRTGLVLTVPSQTGLAFSNSIPESRHLTNQIYLNGSGLAAGDVDGDGRTDVFCAGFDNDCALFRNLGGWRFEDITASAGVALPGLDCTGAAFADLDGDGDLDLVVQTLIQGARLLVNDGRGRFQPAAISPNPGRGGMTVAVGDVDGDRWLDLYLVNYRAHALMDMPSARMTFRKTGGRTVVESVNGRPVSDPEFRDRFEVNDAGGIEENGEPDLLLRNDRRGGFVEVPWTGGAFLDEQGQALKAPPRDWGLAAMFRDVNGDGRPDLYVCNDFQSPDRLWINQGDGRLRLAPPLALRHTSLSSMAVDFADLNRDGHDDFLVLEMMSRDHGTRMRWVRENFPHRPVLGRSDDRPQIERNTLQVSRGDGSWAEVAQAAGVEAADWAWACAFLDVDLDGWEDLLVANGMERAGRDLDAAERLKALRTGRRLSDREVFEARRIFPRLATPNAAFRNRGGLAFSDVSRDWGFDLAGISQAIALADLDNDGDQDVLVGNLNAAVAVYRNDAAAPRLAVRLAGQAPNTRGLGARIEVDGGPLPQSQEMTAGGRYLSGDDPVRSFAAGSASELTVRVRWPGGAVSVVRGVPPNSLLEVSEPATPAPADSSPAVPAPTAAPGIGFEDVSPSLAHRHAEEPFDDLARQPLLPWFLSQPGPGIAWVDLDGDADDDLLVGSGRGGLPGVFRNEGGGRLTPWASDAWGGPVPRDIAGLAAWPAGPGPARVLAALDHYEDGTDLGPALWEWDPRRAAPAEIATASESSLGSLAVADIDGDGDLDAFAAGRVVPGRWPESATSRFLRNDGGKLVPDTARSRPLQKIGLVNGALFSDLDQDGDADLVLACEWGPLRVLRQDPAAFVEITDALGLAELTGWWTSVAAGDFDGDGHTDLLAGNWGRNTPYQRFSSVTLPPGTPGGPLRVWAGDLNEDGIVDPIEAHFEPALGKFVPAEPLGTLAQALPFLRGRFPSHAAFAAAGVEEILGDAVGRAQVLSVRTLETTLLLRRGDRFVVHPLPLEVQFAPVAGIAVADADGDGDDDVFLTQNAFALRPYFPRCDAGLGLWLEGDGRGRFRAVPAAESGIRLPGQQRGAAIADFDGDGRADLAVGQTASDTALFRNRRARPGLKVRLAGAASNPAGVGARVRVAGTGPVREIRCGNGHLSQDSLEILLPQSVEPGAGEGPVIRVRWPGGSEREYRPAPGAAAVTLGIDGTIRTSPR